MVDEALVSDELWEAIEPYLPPATPKSWGGRPRVPDRAALSGIIFVLRQGSRWRDLPQALGCGSGVTCWRQLRRWQELGVWQAVDHAILNWPGPVGRHPVGAGQSRQRQRPGQTRGRSHRAQPCPAPWQSGSPALCGMAAQNGPERWVAWPRRAAVADAGRALGLSGHVGRTLRPTPAVGSQAHRPMLRSIQLGATGLAQRHVVVATPATAAFRNGTVQTRPEGGMPAGDAPLQKRGATRPQPPLRNAALRRQYARTE
jgi:transposase